MRLLWKLVFLLPLINSCTGNGRFSRPIFTREPQDVIFPLDLSRSEIILNCAANGYPSPYYRWKHNGKDIDFTTSYHYRLEGGSLAISRPSMNQDTGTYQCLATNFLGTILSQKAKLQFAFHPPVHVTWRPHARDEDMAMDTTPQSHAVVFPSPPGPSVSAQLPHPAPGPVPGPSPAAVLPHPTPPSHPPQVPPNASWLTVTPAGLQPGASLPNAPLFLVCPVMDTSLASQVLAGAYPAPSCKTKTRGCQPEAMDTTPQDMAVTHVSPAVAQGSQSTAPRKALTKTPGGRRHTLALQANKGQSGALPGPSAAAHGAGDGTVARQPSLKPPLPKKSSSGAPQAPSKAPASRLRAAKGRHH